MKKHFNLLFLIFLIPFSICSQNFTITDTNRQFTIEPRFFGINSFQEDGASSTMYLMGGGLYAKITDKIHILTSSFYFSFSFSLFSFLFS